MWILARIEIDKNRHIQKSPVQEKNILSNTSKLEHDLQDWWNAQNLSNVNNKSNTQENILFTQKNLRKQTNSLILQRKTF